MAERAYPEDKPYRNKSKYYYAFVDRYEFGKKYTEKKVVLDVPCGSGWGTTLIDNAEKIYGLDNSKDAIKYAQKNFDGEFIASNMIDMPYKENMFDVALCFEGIEHISKNKGVKLLDELRRVVKKNGLIIGSVPILADNGDNSGNPFHKFEYPEKYLKKILSEKFTIKEYINKVGGDGPIVFFVVCNDK